MKELKEFFGDPKKKSLTQLGIYFVFFIFVFIIIISNNNQGSQDVAVESNIEGVNSYEYTYTTVINDILTKVEGTYYNGDEIFTLNDSKYYVHENVNYKIVNNELEENIDDLLYIDKFKYKDIEALIDLSNSESTTTYSDGRIKTNYNLSSSNYYSYYNLESDITGTIKIIVVKNNSYISEVEIDLTEISTYDIYKITIVYDSINEINNLELNLGKDW